MFQLVSQATFFAPVSFHFLAEGGELQESGFRARFKHLDQQAFDAFTQRLGLPDADATELLKEVLIGWDDQVLDEGGQLLAYTPHNRDRLVAVRLMASKLLRAFFDANRAAAEKNFPPAQAGSTANAAATAAVTSV